MNRLKLLVMGAALICSSTVFTGCSKSGSDDVQEPVVKPDPVVNPDPDDNGANSSSDENKLAVGKVIGYDGNIYANKDGAEAVSAGNAAAVIVYLGSDTKDATFKNGLAIALDDEGSMNWSTAMSTCGAKTAITGAKWCLPSKNQWQQMFKANGGNKERYTGLNTTITTAGGTTLQEPSEYWSSSEGSPGVNAYGVYLNNGIVGEFDGSQDHVGPVRACLAF